MVVSSDCHLHEPERAKRPVRCHQGYAGFPPQASGSCATQELVKAHPLCGATTTGPRAVRGDATVGPHKSPGRVSHCADPFRHVFGTRPIKEEIMKRIVVIGGGF